MADRDYRRFGDDAEDRSGVTPPEAAPAGGLAREELRRERTPPTQFLREVRQELRKVAWPTRQEVVSYTLVVLAATIVLTSIVFGMDYVFGELVFAIFGS